jgi:two-component system, LytTR family, response regulator LytT
MKLNHHILFWLSIACVLTLGFGLNYNELDKAFFFVCFFMPVAIATSYFFNYFLVPRYLLKGDYFRFGLYLFYTLIGSLYLEMLVITLSFIVLANYSINELSPMMKNSFALAVTVYCIVFIQTSILLIIQLREHRLQIDVLKLEQEKNKQQILSIRSNRQQVQVKLNEITHIESLSDYLKIYLTEQNPIVTKETITSMQELLPSNFLRIHRSFIVNTDFVSQFTTIKVQLGELEIPISRTYKESALKQLQKSNSEQLG